MAKKQLTLTDVEEGTKFSTKSGMKGFLIEKSIGSATVLIYDVPKTRAYLKPDGSMDTYWTGKLRWGLEVEIEVIK
jgi:hypothetical protein|tara:strand:+ start:514 stop:741 length:228 start_codon:yes stop_codon:yes gene_type:complete